MYKRWKQIRKEFNINKEDIKNISRNLFEDGLCYIEVEDTLGTIMNIYFNAYNKTYEIEINMDNIFLCTYVLSLDDEPILYQRQNDNSLVLF